MLVGTVRYNGNHYFVGEEVKGSNVMVEDGKLYLLDDEEYISFGVIVTNDTWVEVTNVRVEDE